MAYEFRLPDLGEGLTEGEVGRWLVEDGQEIAEDDPLVEVQTDKATVEIPSPAPGIVSRILVPEGEVVAVGTVLVVIGEEDGSPRAAAPEVKKLVLADAPPAAPRPRARPCARRRSSAGSRSELGVDLAQRRGHRPAGPGHRGGRPRPPRRCARREARTRRGRQADPACAAPAA